MFTLSLTKQSTRAPEGWYKTALPWNGNHPELPNNRDESRRGLNSLTRELRCEPLCESPLFPNWPCH